MTRTVYLNGEYMPEDQAKVSVFDRGFLFADGVYEVTSVLGGKLLDFDGHAVRLARSLGELGMANPITKDDLLAVHRELVRLNDIEMAWSICKSPAARLTAISHFPPRAHRKPSCCSPRPNRAWPTAPWRRPA